MSNSNYNFKLSNYYLYLKFIRYKLNISNNWTNFNSKSTIVISNTVRVEWLRNKKNQIRIHLNNSYIKYPSL